MLLYLLSSRLETLYPFSYLLCYLQSSSLQHTTCDLFSLISPLNVAINKASTHAHISTRALKVARVYKKTKAIGESVEYQPVEDFLILSRLNPGLMSYVINKENYDEERFGVSLPLSADCFEMIKYTMPGVSYRIDMSKQVS